MEQRPSLAVLSASPYYVADMLTNQRLYFSGYFFTDTQLLAMASQDQMLAADNRSEQCSSLPLSSDPPPRRLPQQP